MRILKICVVIFMFLLCEINCCVPTPIVNEAADIPYRPPGSPGTSGGAPGTPGTNPGTPGTDMCPVCGPALPTVGSPGCDASPGVCDGSNSVRYQCSGAACIAYVINVDGEGLEEQTNALNVICDVTTGKYMYQNTESESVLCQSQ